MERNYMSADALVELEFLMEPSKGIHYHENFELLFVVSGKMDMIIEDQSWSLKQGDMILTNPNVRHTYQITQEMVVARFNISNVKVRELLGMDRVCFWCNSAADHSEGYDQLRRIIHQIIHQAFQQKNRTRLFMNSMYYQMLHVLAEYFLIESVTEVEHEGGNSDRMQEIFAFIRLNYRENISLQDLSDRLYLSTAYISRFIKQKCDMTFLELLNQVRLGHAMEDLLYTDESVTKIALNNGFASVAAYNKAFRSAYDVTPTEYRKKRRDNLKNGSAEKEMQSRMIQLKVDEYLDKNPLDQQEEPDKQKTMVIVDTEHGRRAKNENYAGIMINAGRAACLTDAQIQQQVLECKTHLKTEYVRIEHLFDSQLLLCTEEQPDMLNMSRINVILDFLVRNRLKPYIELSDKPIWLHRNMKQIIDVYRHPMFFQNEKKMQSFYSRLFSHFVKRYGEEEVGQWYFEYWEDNGIFFDAAGEFSVEEIDKEGHLDYLRRFGLIAEALRKIIPEAKIGGAGFVTRILGEKRLGKMLSIWKEQEQTPDFISINCYPYILEKVGKTAMEKRNADPGFVAQHIGITRAAMQKAGMGELPLHVSEYALSLSDRNPVNDSCYNGAWVMYNALQCMGKADMIGYWMMSDRHAEHSDTCGPLFGATGLMSRDGFCKPSMFALDYMGRLYPNICYADNACAVTRSSRSKVRIVCHNMKRPGIHYYLKEEDTIRVEDVAKLTEDCSFLTMCFKISGMEDETYIISRNLINRKHGSIQELWIELNQEDNLSMYEMNYLHKAAISHMSMQEIEVKNHILEFETTMMPNEFQYIYVYPK